MRVTVGAPAAAPALAGDAALGKEVYARECARCHGSAGQGSPRGPKLIGEGTAARAMSKQQLYDYVRSTMPFDRPGTLSDAEYQQVVEYLRAANGLP